MNIDGDAHELKKHVDGQLGFFTTLATKIVKSLARSHLRVSLATK